MAFYCDFLKKLNQVCPLEGSAAYILVCEPEHRNWRTSCDAFKCLKLYKPLYGLSDF